MMSFVLRNALAAAVLLAPAFALAQPAPEPAQPAEEFAFQPPAPPAPPSDVMMFFQAGGSWLGVGVKEINSERARALNLKDEHGVEITTVEPDSPADKAGLKPGDVVLEYNGQRVEGTAQFVRFVRETPPGRTVRLTVFRNGSTQTVTATIAERKGRGFSLRSPGIEEEFNIRIPRIEGIPDMPRVTMSWRTGMLGIEGEPLRDSQLADFFGVKDGVLVRSVMKGTPAEKAGLKAGDVIVKVDDRKVSEPRDITNALRSARDASKKTLPVVVVREKKETTLQVTLEDEPSRRPAAPRARRVLLPQDRL
ncbi:MAG: PDZ domain-containing protein [Bryobacteraceae bacterium]|nr:PDZ domain-containing protein [Bryobacteraceae bacterium]